MRAGGSRRSSTTRIPDHLPAAAARVAVLSRVLADHSDLRRRLTDAIMPPAPQPTIEHPLATLPASTIPFVVGLIGQSCRFSRRSLRRLRRRITPTPNHTRAPNSAHTMV